MLTGRLTHKHHLELWGQRGSLHRVEVGQPDTGEQVGREVRPTQLLGRGIESRLHSCVDRGLLAGVHARGGGVPSLGVAGQGQPGAAAQRRADRLQEGLGGWRRPVRWGTEVPGQRGGRERRPWAQLGLGGWVPEVSGAPWRAPRPADGAKHSRMEQASLRPRLSRSQGNRGFYRPRGCPRVWKPLPGLPPWKVGTLDKSGKEPLKPRVCVCHTLRLAVGALLSPSSQGCAKDHEGPFHKRPGCSSQTAPGQHLGQLPGPEAPCVPLSWSAECPAHHGALGGAEGSCSPLCLWGSISISAPGKNQVQPVSPGMAWQRKATSCLHYGVRTQGAGGTAHSPLGHPILELPDSDVLESRTTPLVNFWILPFSSPITQSWWKPGAHR